VAINDECVVVPADAMATSSSVKAFVCAHAVLTAAGLQVHEVRDSGVALGTLGCAVDGHGQWRSAARSRWRSTA
jgi:hypothetical protein